jgi:hypothetical protein
MAKQRRTFTCIGLGDVEISRLNLLLKFFSSTLDVDWTAEHDGSESQICMVDLDQAVGEEFWRTGAADYGDRIAVTDSIRDGIEWNVLRPWHRSDKNGLVAVLNRLAAHRLSSVLSKPAVVLQPQLHAIQGSLNLAAVIADCERELAGIRLRFVKLPDIWLNGARLTYSTTCGPNLILDAFRSKSAMLESAERTREFPAGEERPLAQLKWIHAISTAHATDEWGGRYFRLKRWPDFASLPHDLVHLRLAASMLRQPMMLGPLAKILNATIEDAVAFCAGVECLELLEEHPRDTYAPPPRPATTHPVVQEGAAPKSQLLRKVLTALYARQA